MGAKSCWDLCDKATAEFNSILLRFIQPEVESRSKWQWKCFGRPFSAVLNRACKVPQLQLNI